MGYAASSVANPIFFMQFRLHPHRRVEDLHPVGVAVGPPERRQPDFLECGTEHVLVMSFGLDPLAHRAVRAHVRPTGDVFARRPVLDAVIPEDGEHVPAVGARVAEALGELLGAQARRPLQGGVRVEAQGR